MGSNILPIHGIVKRYFVFPKCLRKAAELVPERRVPSSAIAAANDRLRCGNARSSTRMDRKQAAEIKRHLLNAGRALHRADFALFKLGKAEREPFAEMMFDLYHTLHFKVLPTLYAQHPELEPPPEPPTIVSTLRWQDVSLPHPIGEAYLDALIFAELKPRFLKMARIVGNVCVRCE